MSQKVLVLALICTFSDAQQWGNYQPNYNQWYQPQQQTQQRQVAPAGNQQQWNTQQQQQPNRNQWNTQQQQQQVAPVNQQTQNYNQQMADWNAQQQLVLQQQQQVIDQQQAQAARTYQPAQQRPVTYQAPARNNNQQDYSFTQAPVSVTTQQPLYTSWRPPGRNVPQGTVYQRPPTQQHEQQPDVHNQRNEEDFRRGKNEPWEGDDDAEYTKSQEAGMIAPNVPWKVKHKMYQVPIKYDENVHFSSTDLRKIKKHLHSAAKKMKLNFTPRQYETYYLLISTLKRCTANSLRQHEPNYNAIPVCLDASLDHYNEIYRATVIGFQVNEKIAIYESSEDSANGEVNDEDEDNESDATEEDDTESADDDDEDADESEEESEEDDSDY